MIINGKLLLLLIMSLLVFSSCNSLYFKTNKMNSADLELKREFDDIIKAQNRRIREVGSFCQFIMAVSEDKEMELINKLAKKRAEFKDVNKLITTNPFSDKEFEKWLLIENTFSSLLEQAIVLYGENSDIVSKPNWHESIFFFQGIENRIKLEVKQYEKIKNKYKCLRRYPVFNEVNNRIIGNF